MTYERIVKDEAWLRTIRPAGHKGFAFHPANFYLTLSRMKLTSTGEPRCLMGISRYLPIFGVEAKPKTSQSDSLLSLSIWREENPRLHFTNCLASSTTKCIKCIPYGHTIAMIGLGK